MLPRATFGRIARSLVKDIEPADAEYAALRVVAVRFDPCFGGAPCVAQLRVVLQAIDSASGRAHDGAVHLLYDLTEQGWVALVRDLRLLMALAPENTAGLPFGPSPALASQGTNGPYGAGLRALVARHAGAANLARMTFMTRTLARAGQWEFGGVNLRGFSPAGDLDIAGLPAGTRLQTVAAATSPVYRYSLTPATVRLPALLTVINGETVGDVAPEARAATHEALARIENPVLETPETADCASCHLANRMRGYLDAKHPQATSPSTLYPGQAQARGCWAARRCSMTTSAPSDTSMQPPSSRSEQPTRPTVCWRRWARCPRRVSSHDSPPRTLVSPRRDRRLLRGFESAARRW